MHTDRDDHFASIPGIPALSGDVGDTPDTSELTSKFEIVREIGRGGMAVVYLARDRATDAERAIKVLHAKYLANREALSRFSREAELIALLDHACIVKVHGVERAGAMQLALVMDYVRGRTVKQLVNESGPLAPDVAQRILRDVASALRCAHESDIVHRDVKPENIFIDEQTGRAVLADFGIARSMHGETSLTLVGMAIGTPTYMSPEQIDGDVDARGDLYSLGVVGWEMLTGRRPWDGDNLYKVIYHQKHDPLPSIRSLMPDAPERLTDVIEALLEKRPEDRWQSAEAFMAALDGHGASRPLRATPRTSLVLASTMSTLPVAHSLSTLPAPRRKRPLVRRMGQSLAALAIAASATLVFARPQAPGTAVDGSGASAPHRGHTRNALPLRAPAASSDEALDASTLDMSQIPVVVPVSRVQVAAGAMHTCVVNPDGNSYCWGDNDAGQAGNGGTTTATTPGKAVARVRFAAMALGSSHTCGLTSDGIAYCWGSDNRGQLGNAASAASARPTSATPARVTTDEQFHGIAAGLSHTCAVTTEGDVYCWGAGGQGELGNGTAKDRDLPVRARIEHVQEVVAGWNHTCALTIDGRAVCWGANDNGQLGDGTHTDRADPTVVSTSLRFRTLSAGSAHTCGVTTSGETYCWGDNRYGQLGDGTTEQRVTPVRVSGDAAFVRVVAGGVYTCALSRSHDAWCWGRNNYGQLGDGTSSDQSHPALVDGGHRFATLSAFGAHTCGTTLNDDVFCWGDNLDGQLGDGTREHRSRPVYVEKPSA